MAQFKWEFDITEVEFIETDNNGDYNIHLHSNRFIRSKQNFNGL